MSDKKPKTVKEFATFADKMVKANAIIDPYQTARETTSAMATQYMAELKSVMEKHKTLEKPYLICAHTRRDLPIETCLHTTFVARRSIPTPEWSTSLYSVDNASSTVHLLWSLPSDADAKQIIKRPDLFNEKLVADCHSMLTKGPDNFTYKKIEVRL